VAILVATAAALLFAAVAAPRVDFAGAAARRLDAGPEASDLTPHQREEALAQAGKVGAVAVVAGAAVSPALSAVALAAVLFLAFRVAGTRPGFRDSLAVAAHGLLPLALKKLLTIPALLVASPVGVERLPGLLPSSLAALLPPSAPPALSAGLSGLDLFGLLAAVLVAAGMARVAGATRLRAGLVVAVLWVAQLALFTIVPAAQMARGAPGA
jgi:hypothetical protein